MTPKPMKLQSLNIFRSHDEQLVTTVKFSGYSNEVTLRLDPELGARILELCMDEIGAAIRDSAADAQAALRNAQNLQIEGNKENQG